MAALPAELDPSNFQPVCPASDGIYRFGQTVVVGLVGGESYKEYAPLIAGGLLRVRLELCVVESFVYEAILPFIKEKGLSWVLPLHETVCVATAPRAPLGDEANRRACAPRRWRPSWRASSSRSRRISF